MLEGIFALLGRRMVRIGIVLATGGLLGLPSAANAAAPQPDLVLGVYAPSSVVKGAVFNYRVKLHNDGAAPALPASVMGAMNANFEIVSVIANDPAFQCQFSNSAGIFGVLWACAAQQPLASQATVIADVKVRAPLTARSYTLQHVADPNNHLVETNENNNQKNVTIRVTN